MDNLGPLKTEESPPDTIPILESLKKGSPYDTIPILEKDENGDVGVKNDRPPPVDQAQPLENASLQKGSNGKFVAIKKE